jgi:predicted ATPase
LADQFVLEDNNNTNNSYTVGERQRGPQLPPQLLSTPYNDWANHVIVHCGGVDMQCGGELEPLPTEAPSSNPQELQDILNSFLNDDDQFSFNGGVLEQSSIHIAEESSNTPHNEVSYHNVARAEILPFANTTTNNVVTNNVVDETHVIYSLGIVFYELFSRGERPILDDQTDPLDFAVKLNISSGGGAGGGDDSLGVGDDSLKHPHEPLAIPGQDDFIPPSAKRPSLTNTPISHFIEHLKLKGLPDSLCNLIINMFDAKYGYLSGNEAYRTVSDVRTDLQLMLDKPDRFLRELDLEKLLDNGLQINEAVFDRETEFSTLHDSYTRSIDGVIECVVIVGASGTGKTVLANRLGNFVSATGALFLTGKFDQLQQATPFSALASAFNEYCNQMSNGGRLSILHQIASKIKTLLGDDTRYLSNLIPNLGIILGEDGKQEEGIDCANAQARIQHLLCLFVDLISSSSGVPIVLFLDDLQWSDRASLGAINQLLTYFTMSTPKSKRHFFFLGSRREEGLLEQHPFGSMLAKIGQFGIQSTVVRLDCIDKDATNTIVSDLLCLSPRLTRTLSDIVYHKSKGNPLFISQLMISLCRNNGLVWLSLSRRRWEWDEAKIQALQLPDDVVAFLSSTIEKLPTEVQSALMTLSCFGNRSDCVLLETIEGNLGIPLIQPLQKAVAEGIIEKVGESYSFGHDKLQEAVYRLILPEVRPMFHFKYGLSLVHRARELNDDGMLFTATNQINLGGVAIVTDATQAVEVANLNLMTGFKAMGMSDFSSASSFFNHGISFLPKRHWQEHYDLSLQLFESASKCALINGDADSLKYASDQILRFAKRFEDKLNTLLDTISALSYNLKIPEAIKMTKSVLSQLGIELPEVSDSDLKTTVDQTNILLHGLTDQNLIEHKLMTDPTKLMAMLFLARLEITLQLAMPASAPAVTKTMIELSIDSGMSPVSPVCFVYFGQHLATCGNIEEGCRYVNIAKKLQVRMGARQFAGDVIGIGSQLLHFIEPLQLTREYHAEGMAIAMAAGDMQGAMLNRMMYAVVTFYCGMKLINCKEIASLTGKLLQHHGHAQYLAHHIQFVRGVDRLMGIRDVHNEESESITQAKEILKKGTNSGSIHYNFQRMYIHFMFREYEDIKIFADQLYSFNFYKWVILISYAYHKFFGGLVSFWIYRQSNDPIWASRGREELAQMKKWAESSQHNFQHKVCLLEAEEAFSNHDYQGAQILYEKAVSTARESR